MKHTLPENTLLQISEFVAEHLALNFPKERWSDLERNITAAATEFGYTGVENFIQRIMSLPMTHEHVEILTAHLAINETYFWREPETFEALEQSIIPELIRSRQEGKRIRIWSAGCSTGEEPYSIAIALHRAIPQIKDWNITILATDINRRILHRAPAGLFSEWSFRNSPRWLKEKYVSLKEKDIFEIIPEIKRMVKFEYLNLADDVFPSLLNNTNAMDFIFCRNVLMYFSEKRCSQVVNGLFNSLVQNGYLVVSASELSLPSLSEFTAVNFPGMVLFQKSSNNPKVHQQIPAEVSVRTPRGYTWQVSPIKIIKEIKPQLRGIENEILPEAEIPLQIHSVVDKALALYAQGNYTEVTEMLQQDDQTSEERILFIRAYANQGKIDMALQTCEKAIAADKLNPGLYYLYAAILQENNQLDEAVISLKRAIFLDPNFVLSHYSLGNIYQRLGNIKSANKCTEIVLTILNTHNQDEILFESEGLTAGRFKEIIIAADQTRDLV
ncbi:MAG: tetratricopeptide repeat protein [Ignavibacteriales bacterium]|nr:tetratricopeptide repeat protein [Ignavibacteriales bacterium]